VSDGSESYASCLMPQQGRSPYEDVVEGTGEEDPHEPKRHYDEKGRIVNRETKTIIKDIIRSHNEVMQVIGVAELENNSAEDGILVKEHEQYETETGQWLLKIGRGLTIVGSWGIQGLRQRLMVSHRKSLRQGSLHNTDKATGLPAIFPCKIHRTCAV
jgi:hypothetical protein